MTDAQSMGADARPYHDGLARLFRANRAALGITDPIDAGGRQRFLHFGSIW